MAWATSTVVTGTIITSAWGNQTRDNFLYLGGASGEYQPLAVAGAAPATPAANVLYKDSIAKGWVSFDTVTSTTILDDLNVASLTDNGTGDTTVVWERDFANDDYAISALGSAFHTSFGSVAVGSVRVFTYNASHAATDALCMVTAFGDQ